MPHIQLDVDWITHPKTLSVSPLAQLLFVRSLIYCVKHLTDGHLSFPASKHLALDLAQYQVDASPRRDIATSSSNYLTPEWLISELISSGLWEQNEQGIIIHDFLDYHSSRRQVAQLIKNKVESGRKGGLSRAQRLLSKTVAQVKHDPSERLANGQANYVAKSSPIPIPIPIPIKEEEREEGKPSPKSAKAASALISDEEWIAGLKRDEIYSGIDIDLEIRKSSAWYQEHNRKWTRKAFTNWLIRAMGDKPMQQPKRRILLT
jgi:hypothetical protein